MRFLLDSNIVIALMNGNEASISHAERVNPDNVYMSTIVQYELLYGAFNSDRVDANLQRFSMLSLPVVVFDEADAREAGRIRADLRRRGTPIGPYDVMLAGQALARDLTLVTNNMREFERVEGLRLEDWTLPR